MPVMTIRLLMVRVPLSLFPLTAHNGCALPHLGEADLDKIRLGDWSRLGQYLHRAGGVGDLIVQSCWQYSMSHGEQAGGQLRRAAAGAEVTDVRLDAPDGNR